MDQYKISVDRKTGRNCWISNLRLSKNEKFVVPIKNENVFYLVIEDSKIPRFTEDLLVAFPNLAILDASKNEIEEVSEDAFVGCQKLIAIDLSENNIKTLEQDTFNRNKNLQYINLDDNQLDSLPKQLFLNLENLITLKVERNNLTSWSKKLLINLTKLEDLYVNGNQLLDLRIEEILKQCPKLEIFQIQDNNFNLIALQIIIQALNAARVNFKDNPNHPPRLRSYATQQLDGIVFIPDDEYAKLLYKRKSDKWFAIIREKLDLIQNDCEEVQKSEEEDKEEDTKGTEDILSKLDLIEKGVSGKFDLIQNDCEEVQKSEEEDKEEDTKGIEDILSQLDLIEKGVSFMKKRFKHCKKCENLK